MLARKVVESPDSAQPKPPHAGSCSSVPLRSWPAARKVSAPVGDEAAAGVPGTEAGVLGNPAKLAGAALVLGVLGMLGVLTAVGVLKAEDAAALVEELQAVNSTAMQASDAQAATCRGLGAFVILMVSNPSINEGAARRAMSALGRRAPGAGWKTAAQAGTTVRSGKKS